MTQTLMELPFTMDLFQHRYYRINKILLKIIGQWPYQTIHTRYTIIAFMLLISISQFVPMLLAIAKHPGDWELLLDCITPTLYGAACAVRTFCGLFSTQKMLKLLNRICTDWQVWAEDEEVNILNQYANQGRKLSILLTVMFCSCNILFTIQPVIPIIIDVLLKNNSEPREFPIPVDYYHLDMQKYYFYIIMHCFVTMSIVSTISIAWGAIFIVYVQHCCGIFTATGLKLERIGNNQRSTESDKALSVLDKQDMDFKLLVSCIDRHNDAIKYAELIEAIYSPCFFFIVGFNMLVISVSAIQIVKTSIKLHEALRFVVINIIAMTHLYVESYMAQSLMDHSIRIRHNILNTKWYTLPLKAQKLLPLMMMRCNVPCKLTAGKISVMSMSSFGAILRTSLSYFTLLRSI